MILYTRSPVSLGAGMREGQRRELDNNQRLVLLSPLLRVGLMPYEYTASERATAYCISYTILSTFVGKQWSGLCSTLVPGEGGGA